MSIHNQIHWDGYKPLDTAQVERFGLLGEELGEAIQAIGKIARHGFGATDPVGNYYDNKTQLEKELGDIVAATMLSASAGEVSIDNVMNHALIKMHKIASGQAFLHCQPQDVLRRIVSMSKIITDAGFGKPAETDGEEPAKTQAMLRSKAEPAKPFCIELPSGQRVMIIKSHRLPTQEELANIVTKMSLAEIDPMLHKKSCSCNGCSPEEPEGHIILDYSNIIRMMKENFPEVYASVLQSDNQDAAPPTEDKADAPTVPESTMQEISDKVAAIIAEADFMYPTRSNTKKFDALIAKLRAHFGEHYVFDYPKRRLFHRAIDVRNWAMHGLIQNSFDLGEQ